MPSLSGAQRAAFLQRERRTISIEASRSRGGPWDRAVLGATFAG
jgi:hypothetical protein